MNSRQGQFSLLFLKSADIAVLLVALGLTIVINYSSETDLSIPGYSIDFLSAHIKLGNAILFGLVMIVWHFCFKVQGLYFSVPFSSQPENIEKGRESASGLFDHFVHRCRICKLGKD